MSTRMLIDAAHPEETRVAVVRGNRIEEFDFEAANRSSQRGNIYLARVTRVEPSLQAAFVEYGGNRHGFLAFNEIHPDYYQIPHEDRQALLDEEAAQESDSDDDADENGDAANSENGPEVEEVGADDAFEDASENRRRGPERRYKIQEVIKRRQILLVQVVKEERGTKGAALTTYMSLAGRYCVLMPNTARGGGVSRRIGTGADRKRLKKILKDLDVPQGMGCIIRTNGASRTKTEIKRDYSYLIKLWSSIRELTLESIAPALIYEEGNLIKRTIRDMYSSEIDEIYVDGAEGYRAAKDMMKMLIPSHAKKVQHYKDPIPLFQRYQVENQLSTMYETTVPLKSGGYLVINPTEALVAVDVNSGKATRERNIERTAYRTNMEAAEEVARQLRLRDLAGLIVIDFIDMEESRNNRSVERKMKECLKTDRARLQVGRISPFGLMEMSRQRLRPGMLEASTQTCPYCEGAGTIRSTESTALQVMRDIEEEGVKSRNTSITATVPNDVALYMLNNKRRDLTDLEARFEITVEIAADPDLHRPHFKIGAESSGEAPARESRKDDAKGQDKKKSQSRSKAKSKARPEKDGDDEEPRSKRRRGRRGGRRRRKSSQSDDQPKATAPETGTAAENEAPAEQASDAPETADVAGQPDELQPDVTEEAFPLIASAPETAEPEADASSEPETAPEPESEAETDVVVDVEAPPEEPEPAVTEIAGAAPESEPEPELAPEPVEVAAELEPAPEPEEEYTGPRRSGWWNRDA